jgi:LysM repeat protein/lipoprotein-anchoring transpeptidase ErfK/SrfK
MDAALQWAASWIFADMLRGAKLKPDASSEVLQAMRLLPPPVIAAVLAAALPASLLAQAPPPVRIEPGLEKAVSWKWWVSPSNEADWGLPLPETGVSNSQNPAETGPRPTTYEVQRGDALAKISRRFGMTADQLKTYNGLTSDTIHIGQVLKIPSLVELTMMAPPPPPPDPAAKAKAAAAPQSEAEPSAPKGPALTSEAKTEMETVLVQVFLDRHFFSSGPIDGRGGPVFNKTLELYRTIDPSAEDLEQLREKARQEIGNAYTTYKLKREDMRFIAPPQAPTLGSGLRRKSKSTKPVEPPISYEDLVSPKMLAYRSAWEFVAERFHCEESFVRKLNSKITGLVTVGTEFLVPNVQPFEIEKVFEGALQPAADAGEPVTATVAELSRIEVYRGEKLVAVMPMTVARPDLRGRGSWTVLDVIPRPRLATLQEVKEAPKKKTPTFTSFTVEAPEPEPPPPGPALSQEQYLPPGPNNPVGIIWINLAKANTTEALPYGLHGTSIPERMKTQESIGGLRVANWDIARLVRLLPQGTPLRWK